MILRNPGTLERSGQRLFFHSNRALREEPLYAILCSRACPGAKIIEAFDLAQQWRVENRSVISDFHTPVERECLRIFLRGPQHLVLCPARGLDPFQLPNEWQKKYELAEMLIVSPFDSSIRRPTRDTAEVRTRLVLDLATKRTIIYGSPGGLLDKLSKGASREPIGPGHK